MTPAILLYRVAADRWKATCSVPSNWTVKGSSTEDGTFAEGYGGSPAEAIEVLQL